MKQSGLKLWARLISEAEGRWTKKFSVFNEVLFTLDYCYFLKKMDTGHFVVVFESSCKFQAFDKLTTSHASQFFRVKRTLLFFCCSISIMPSSSILSFFFENGTIEMYHSAGNSLWTDSSRLCFSNVLIYCRHYIRVNRVGRARGFFPLFFFLFFFMILQSIRPLTRNVRNRFFFRKLTRFFAQWECLRNWELEFLEQHFIIALSVYEIFTKHAVIFKFARNSNL